MLMSSVLNTFLQKEIWKVHIVQHFNKRKHIWYRSYAKRENENYSLAIIDRNYISQYVS